jgi:hypothetical protein
MASPFAFQIGRIISRPEHPPPPLNRR